MATTDKEERVGEHAGQDLPVGGKMPTMPTPSTDPLTLDSVGSNHVTFQPYNLLFEPPHLIDPPATEEDQMKTPMLEHPPLVNESLASKLGEPVQSYNQQHYKGNGKEDIDISGHPDYFTQKVPQDSLFADISRTSSSSNVSSTGLSDFIPTQLDTAATQLDTSSRPVSPGSRAYAWRDYVPSFIPENNRPVSVPNFRSKASSRRRDGPDYPKYPDQSFMALQNEHYSLPRRPGESHHLRTRSSHPPQNQCFSSGDETSSLGYPHNPSGAKTVGNTPAQSPGLFTPVLSRKDRASESDEKRSGTPMLHPAHLQAPKE